MSKAVKWQLVIKLKFLYGANLEYKAVKWHLVQSERSNFKRACFDICCLRQFQSFLFYTVGI
jgi:hypothetical protein